MAEAEKQLVTLRRRGGRLRKYRADNLMPVLRLFAEAREQALKQGFTDNGGAIHSIERILDILGRHLCYPHNTHAKDLKADAKVEISRAAYRARQRGEQVRIEHVLPQRAFAQQVCELIQTGATNKTVLNYITANYRLVIVTPKEAAALDQTNRSRIAPDRLADIVLRAMPADKSAH
jgi:hypothetical protein